MDRTDHIFLVESPYMDRTDLIFLVEVHIWTSLTTYFGMKSNPKPISQNQIPNLYPGDPIPKPYPQTQSQTYIPNPIPNLYPKKQSQTHIPKPNPKPISQTHIPNPYPKPNPKSNPKPPNLYPQTQSQTYIPNPIPILECFSGRLRFPVFRFSGKGRQHDRGS